MRSFDPLAIIIALLLTGCSEEPEAYVQSPGPPQCSKAVAEAVASRMVDRVIAEVRQPRQFQTQEGTCETYARGLAGIFFHHMVVAEEADKARCDEFNFEVDPEKLYMARLEAFRPEASQYCPGIDSAVSREAIRERGRNILDSLPAGERKQVEDAWLDSAGR